MVPLTRPWRSRNASLSWQRTSTSALPMPMTSISSATPRLLLVQREVLAVQEIEPTPRRVRERPGAGDHRVLEQARTLARARAADHRDEAPEHLPDGHHGLQQIDAAVLDALCLACVVPDA